MLPSTVGVRKKDEPKKRSKKLKRVQGLAPAPRNTFQKVPMDLAAIDAALTKANS
jgi:hypothetical protein